MRQITKITHCKYLQVGLLCLMPLGISSICAAQETAQKSMTAAQMDAEFPIPAPKQVSSDSYDLLVMAGKSIDEADAGPPDADEVSPAEDLRKQRAFVKKNAASLEMMQKALSQPIVPPLRRDLEDTDGGHDNSALRNLGRLVMQRNRVAAADENWNGALDGAFDIVQMGVDMGTHIGIMGMFTSAALQKMGREDVWNWIEHSDAQTAQQAAQRLEKLDAATPIFADVMREEKWVWLSYLKEMLTSPEWEAFRKGDRKEVAQFPVNRADTEILRKVSDRDILRNYLATMDAVVAQAAQSYLAKPIPIPAAADPLSALHTSLYAGPQEREQPISFRATMEKARAENRLLLTALALHAFQKDNGHYPQKLDELTGKYLQSVPRDPFAADAPMRYKIEGEKYLLYSVGGDGVDNGGVALKRDAPDKDGVVPIPDFDAPGDLLAGEAK